MCYLQQNLRRTFWILTLSMLCFVSFAQQQGQVQGLVKDKSGEPLIGANVTVKNTTNGTITNLDGVFVLTGVKKSDVLSVSYIGYKSKDVKYNG